MRRLNISPFKSAPHRGAGPLFSLERWTKWMLVEFPLGGFILVVILTDIYIYACFSCCSKPWRSDEIIEDCRKVKHTQILDIFSCPFYPWYKDKFLNSLIFLAVWSCWSPRRDQQVQASCLLHELHLSVQQLAVLVSALYFMFAINIFTSLKKNSYRCGTPFPCCFLLEWLKNFPSFPPCKPSLHHRCLQPGRQWGLPVGCAPA